jgi:GNAT superfamily N-acetyltransferase
MEYEIKPLSKEEAKLIDKKVGEYDDSLAVPDDGVPEDEDFVLKVEDETGSIIAGCVGGFYNWGQMEIDILWVDERYRGRGLGSYLLCEAEHMARERGCYISILGSLSFEAKGLYEKHGYTVYKTVEDWPKGYLNYSLSKRLDTSIPDYIPKDNSLQAQFEIGRGSEEDADRLWDALERFEYSFAPEKHDYIPLNRKLTAEDGGLVAGVLSGVNEWDGCFLDALWVEEPYRNRGLGSYLLAEAEREAKENGAAVVFVCTFDWAYTFFVKRGYTVTGCLEDHPRGHCMYTLEKRL